MIGIKYRKWFWFCLAMTALFILLVASPVLAKGPGGGGGGGGGGWGGGGGGSGVVDPPPGLPFVDPPILDDKNDDPNIFEGYLEAKVATVNVNGVQARLLTYNGLYPGPMIKVKRGDTLKLHFTNSLASTSEKNILGFYKNHTNIHTHGFHVSPMEPADAAHLDIPPGGEYDYEYDLSLVDAGTLAILHPHSHGLVAEQYWGGMIGTIQVADNISALSAYERHTLILKDITLSGNQPEAYSSQMDFMQGKEGNIIMVNGLVNPVLPIKPGQVQRWQIVNGSNARYYKLSLENHTMYLVGTDDGLLDKYYPVSSLLLAPGERADILVEASATTRNYRLLALPYARKGMMTSPQITLMTLSYQGSPVNGNLPNPNSVNPNATRLNPADLEIMATRTLVLSMSQGRGYINGMDFDVEPYEIHSELGTYEIWEIINNSGMDHPFHQHINGAQVLSITGGDSSYASLYTSIPAWKDVVNVPRMGRVKILVPVMDWDGMTMFHCHIVEHEDIGMMGMWHIMGGGM